MAEKRKMADGIAAEIVAEMEKFIIGEPHARHYALNRMHGRIEGELRELTARIERLEQLLKRVFDTGSVSASLEAEIGAVLNDEEEKPMLW